MSLNPDAVGDRTESDVAPEVIDRLVPAYLETYRGPHGGATGAEAAVTGPMPRPVDEGLELPALVEAQYRLGRQRSPGTTGVAVYGPEEPGGFGPALQIVTDNATMLMDSVTVLLHRIGVAYKAIMNPGFRVRRDATGELLEIAPPTEAAFGDGIDETWVHVQLSSSVDRRALAEAETLLPRVLGDARQVAVDSTAMAAVLRSLAAELDGDGGQRFPSVDRKDVAALLRWLTDGHFVLLGYQRCSVGDGEATVDASSRLGVLRLREDVMPQLTSEDDLLALAQATIPSFLRYGAYPQVVVVREKVLDSDDAAAVEHRFVGLFTVAATNANVLEIPLIARRVNDALAMAHRDPSHPGELLLDIIQTIPRPELFAMTARGMLDMAMAVVELGSRRRALLFMRADPLAQFVSCLVYLPRDRYTTAVRLEMQDILVRELGGVSIDYAARVSESPWAVVHFTVLLPEGAGPRGVDVSEANESRIQDLLTEAARTWADRLLGAVKAGSVDQATAEHYASAFPEMYKQATTPLAAFDDIAIIEELQDDSVKLVLTDSDDTAEDGIWHLFWYLGGRSASLSQLLPMLQSMGVVVLEERPFKVDRPDGLTVWIYQFKVSPHRGIPQAPAGPQREEAAHRFAETVTAIWHGRAEIDRFNELVLRAGLTWQQVAIIRAYAKYLRQAGFPYSQSHIGSVLNENPGTARSLVALFEALFCPVDQVQGAANRDAQAAAAAVSADIDALVSLDTDRVLRAFASMIQATLRTNYFVEREDSARAQNVLSFKLNPGLIDELPLPRPEFEIFVYSPRVEGVHLRFGFVARGGLRWSDRREDFRTEILGLVKAQAVKNAVIVPVGAKGGFVVKKPPTPTGDPAVDREATREEGVACYRLFIAGLLDVTDNVDKVSGAVITPAGVVRRDGDDAYLVVAADKGTATFSDIANDVAKSYGFWLGDAFASGGSVGYDHKAMGIT
ncbi:MAG: NAD-glutamate dehydrogenase, partial [Mycobacterium sp.]|nr:NAD-glutamate dehydrogenase [Mycobacterium sp.]